MIDYSNLNPQQHEAVFSDHGRILCLAGAGTGKTQVLTRRIARLFEAGICPENMLALTFTRAAGAEMKERVISLIGEEGKKLFCNTFHAFCVEVIRENASLLGYEPNFSIYDQTECDAVLASVLADLKLKIPVKRINDYRAGKTERMTAADRMAAERGLKEYTNRLKRNNAIDFDGLIETVGRALTTHLSIYAAIHARYQYVFVDEFQDTDGQQWDIVRRFEAKNLFVVGDDFQSIYGFRGSDVSIILGLAGDPNWYTVKLEQNYRSTIPIIAAANALIKHNQQTEKALVTQKDGVAIEFREPSDLALEIYDIAQRLKANQKAGKTTAILARFNKQLDNAKYLLAKQEVPCERLSAADNPLASEDGKTLLYWIAALENPQDDTAIRALAGEALRRFALLETERAQLEDTISFKEALNLTADGRRFLEHFDSNIKEWNAAADLYAKVCKLAERISLKSPAILHEVERWAHRQNAIGDPATGAALVEHVRMYGLSADASKERDASKTYLMTVHGSKGLEFDEVFIIGAAQGTFPSTGNLEEERRLFYVAITRAREYLNISSPRLTTDWHGNHKAATRSQFIREALLI